MSTLLRLINSLLPLEFVCFRPSSLLQDRGTYAAQLADIVELCLKRVVDNAPIHKKCVVNCDF